MRLSSVVRINLSLASSKVATTGVQRSHTSLPLRQAVITVLAAAAAIGLTSLTSHAQQAPAEKETTSEIAATDTTSVADTATETSAESAPEKGPTTTKSEPAATAPMSPN